MLKISKINHYFGTKQVLNSIDLTIEKGEIFVIMGASGGGKSTLLKCISGLLIPAAGDIFYNDTSIIQHHEVTTEKFGFVFQYAALFDSLTVEENILFGISRQKKLSKNEKSELVRKELELVSLKDVEKYYPDQLSGGMQKRVGLARALAIEPDVVFYDEPTSGLDPITAFSIDQLIRDTRTRADVTSVVVTHDVSSAVRLADRIGFLEQGHLTFLGTPQEFLNNPNPTIAELISKSKAETLTLEH